MFFNLVCVVKYTMEFVRGLFSLLKPRRASKKQKEKSTSAVHNPVTTQTSTNNSNPQFITNVHHYPTIGTIPSSITGPALVTTSYETDQSRSTSLSRLCFGTDSFTDPVEWVLAKPETAEDLSDRALVGGYDYDGSPLWVIRTRLDGELLPAKLNIISKGAYLAWHLDEVMVGVFEVCCVPKHKVKWIEASNGAVPTNAVQGGKTSDGEKLYIGRATFDRSLIPGKIQPSHQCCYVTYAFKAHPFKNYEVLCLNF